MNREEYWATIKEVQEKANAALEADFKTEERKA